MKLGVADMEASFVPGKRSQIPMKDGQWDGLPEIERLKLVLDIISKSDFDFLELGVPWINEQSPAHDFKEVTELISKRGLVVGGYSSLMPGHLKTVGPEVNWDEIAVYLRKVFQNCHKLGGEYIVFGSGDSRNLPKQYSPKKAVDDIYQFLTLAAEIIREGHYDFKLILEPLNTDECNFINDLREAYEIVSSISSPSVGILLDTYHAFLQPNPFWTDLPRVCDKLYHVQLAQPEDRHYPGHLKVNGHFDFKRLFIILKDCGYTGEMSVECIFTDLKKQITPCYEFLRNLT